MVLLSASLVRSPFKCGSKTGIGREEEEDDFCAKSLSMSGGKRNGLLDGHRKRE